MARCASQACPLFAVEWPGNRASMTSGPPPSNRSPSIAEPRRAMRMRHGSGRRRGLRHFPGGKNVAKAMPPPTTEMTTIAVQSNALPSDGFPAGRTASPHCEHRHGATERLARIQMGSHRPHRNSVTRAWTRWFGTLLWIITGRWHVGQLACECSMGMGWKLDHSGKLMASRMPFPKYRYRLPG